MRIPRLLALCLPVLVPLAAGCGQKDYSLDLYHHYTGGIKDLLTRHVNYFMEDNPSVKVNFFFKEWEEIEKLMTRAAETVQEDFRDLYIIAHDRIGQLAEAGLIRDVGGYFADRRGQYLPAALEAVTYKGKQYGLPLSSECITLFYNKKLVDKAPATLDELLALRGKFLDRAADRFLLLFPVQIPYFTIPWLYAFGGRVFDETGRARVDLPENVVAFQRLRALFVGQLAMPFVEEGYAAEYFGKGAVPFMISGSWIIPGFKSENIDFGVARIPLLAPGRPVGSFLGVQCIVVSSRVKDDGMRHVYRLFENLVRRDFSRDLSLFAKFVSPLARDHADAALRGDPVIAAFNAQAQASFPMKNTPEMAKIWSALNPGVMRRLLGENVDVAALLGQLQAQIDKRR